MAICGFCKKEVVLERYNKKNPPPNTVIREEYAAAREGRKSMFSCPHCDAVLGFTTREPL